MATTTRRVLRQRVAEAAGDFQELTTTSLGTSTTLIATGFKDLPGGSDDDGFLGFYEYQTSGNNENESRRADLFTESSNTLRVARAHTNAVASGVTFELHRFDPEDYHAAIQQAIAQAYPHLYLPLRDETLVVDNLLLNANFEDGAFTSWVSVGSPTLSAETAIKMHGSQAAKMVAGGADGQQTQVVTVNIREVTGKSARLACWVYATVGDVARIRLDWGGSNFSNSVYHTGTDQWELVILTAAVPATATQIKVIVETAAGGTAYFDAAALTIMPVYRYTIPSAMLKGPYYVTQQADEYDPSGSYYPLSERNYPLAGRRLRLEGMGLLTNPATDTATIEIGAPQTDYLVTLATRNLYRILGSPARSAQQQREGYRVAAEEKDREARELLSRPGVAMPPLGAKDSRGVWHTEESSTERLLILDQAR